ncbi:MAG: hypothetical protein L6W00_27330 [Lentisphaeria bacterium]|nr:MAG: hypothetical protein L6W00_27330 [Lentisphaeria bacterium]
MPDAAQRQRHPPLLRHLASQPSGKFVALLRLPDREEFPRPGDRAEVVLIDTETGGERVVWETAGWEYQLGANINWGADDSQLLFNDVDTTTWTPFGMVLDPVSGASRKLEQCVYHVSPDGRYALSADLRAMRRTQWGYGVMVPDQLVPEHFGPSPRTASTSPTSPPAKPGC